MKENLRELAGKGCLCTIAVVFGIFACNELLWSVSVPKWLGIIFGVMVTAGIAYFLLRNEK